jgi:glucose-1-phosphate cytidylyltransferase
LKVVIFAGGLGTRLMEETEARPKPMVEVGGKPILWHILKIYSHYGFNEFIICLGYKQAYIKEYFLNYYLHNSDITVDLENNSTKVHLAQNEKFRVTLVDTGYNTNTAGRLQKIKKYVEGETFMLTYGDGVADINIPELIAFHKSKGKLATLTTIQTPGRFGNIEQDENGVVKHFVEKPQGDGVWINGGFFVLEPGIFEYLKEDMTEVQWEKKPLIDIAKDNQLASFKHLGFWKCMDALRDKIELDQLWESGNAKWKVW